MKKPETEREIVDLIVNTLENGEEHYILGSWENFVKKGKQKRRLILWFWATGFAASLFIGWLGLRLFVTYSSGINAGSVLNEPLTGNQETLIRNDSVRQDNLILSDSLLPKEDINVIHPQNAIAGQNFSSSNSNYQAYTDSLDIDHVFIAVVNDDYLSDTIPVPSEDDITALQSDSVVSEFPERNGRDKTLIADAKSDSLGIKPSPGILIAEITPEKDIDSRGKTGTKKIRLGVSFSPGISSTNTVSAFNYSGGLSAEMDLSRRFRLSTGLQVEHQNITDKATDSPSWMPEGQTEAVLTGIDLPVNLTWKFNVRQSGCYYFSGGFSSTAYLSEKYITTSYTQKVVEVVSAVGGEQSVNYQLEDVENIEQEKMVPFNSFDFAGRINIILGIEQHLTTKIYLHLEPYIKIPVSGLASQNLRFTTSGVTCKISF